MITSCDDTRLYDEYYTIDKKGWDSKRKIKFSFKQPNVKASCNLFLNVVNNDDYPFSNLFLIVSLEDPKGFTKVDTLEYQMADPMGRLLGKGITEFKENKLWYKEKYNFTEKGVYTIYVEQAVRQQNKANGVQKLQGISKVGLRIESILNQ